MVAFVAMVVLAACEKHSPEKTRINLTTFIKITVVIFKESLSDSLPLLLVALQGFEARPATEAFTRDKDI